MMPWVSKTARLILLFALLLTAMLPAARAVLAAPPATVHLNMNFVSVQADTSVTVRVLTVPIRTKFTILMGDATQKPFQGVEIQKDWTSEKGGPVELTFPIPESLRGVYIIAIKMNSVDGYTAETFFFNRTQVNTFLFANATPSALATPQPTPEITFSEVKKGLSAVVTGKNFPADITVYPRVGPYDAFLLNYDPLPSVKTGADGSLVFTIDLPKRSQPAENVRVRLDYEWRSVTAIFHNVDGGTAVNEKDLVKYIPCQVLDVNPIPGLLPGQEFDVEWTVRNTGYLTWPVHTVDYRYLNGTKMHKYADVFDVNWPVKRGTIFRITVDMVAPQQPGWYSTTWALVQDAKTLCSFNVTVAVVSAPKK
jgi:hypothetical protein